MDPFVLMENFSRAKQTPLLFPPPCPAFCPMMVSHSPAIHNATKGTRILTGSLWVTLPVPSVSLCSVSIQPFFFFFVEIFYALWSIHLHLSTSLLARSTSMPNRTPSYSPVPQHIGGLPGLLSWHCPSISLPGNYLDASKLSDFVPAVHHTVSFL